MALPTRYSNQKERLFFSETEKYKINVTQSILFYTLKRFRGAIYSLEVITAENVSKRRIHHAVPRKCESRALTQADAHKSTKRYGVQTIQGTEQIPL
jgi:hypothetical protein